MSSFTWLDFSDSDRQKALDVIDLFREKGTIDELGIGTVRDALADLLFPGTSTIMTRARYFLFIPWIYKRHEGRRTPSSEISHIARKDEIALVEVLAKAADTRGVIGIDSRANLKRLPSMIYWQGLGQLGIRRYSGSREGYHRSLDKFYKNKGGVIRGDDGHAVAGGKRENWDSAMPNIPDGFPSTATLKLEKVEVEYLRERIMQSAPQSLFAFLVDHQIDDSKIDFPWEHPLIPQMTQKNRSELDHARNFSEVMNGAALLYNFLLAEKKKMDVLRDDYAERFTDWSNRTANRMSELESWSIPDFWALVNATGARVGKPTQIFINGWLQQSIGDNPGAAVESKAARQLITQREHSLKGTLSRLENVHALDLWGGASSSARMDYRWNRPVKTILADLHNAAGDV